MQTNKIHWASLLILIVLGLGASSALLVAFGLGVSSLIGLFSDAADPAAQMISAFTFGFEGIVLLMCSWFVLQKTMGREQAGAPFRFPFAGWQTVAIIGLAITSVAIGAAVVFTEVEWLAWLILPVLTVLVIVPPIWLLFGIGTSGMELGPRWRIFSILGLSMTLGPLVMIVAELVLLAGGIILGAIFLAMQQPDLVQEFGRLGAMLQNEVNQDTILKNLAPDISNPILIAAVVGYIAVVVPLIEELFKPLAVWIFARKLESPAQGFVLGLLSGAAFALVESLNASGGGTEGWPLIVSIRAGTSLLHITTSGLVGWGIASAFREKRILRLFAAYFSAVTIHGVWNACAVGAGLSLVGEVIGKPEWLFNILPAALGGMSILGVGMLFVLIASNRRLRNSPSSPAHPPQGEGSSPLSAGEG
jgi:RsiW-degrading membrane proteinase PrsW (M82 family)